MKPPTPNPPTCVAQVPKTVFNALDVSNVLRTPQIANLLPNSLGAGIALQSIHSYLEAAKRQQRRIGRAISALNDNRRRRTVVDTNLFADVHFSFICWARIHKLIDYLCKCTRFRRLGHALKPYRSELENRRDARHHLEHFEDRLAGGKHVSRLGNNPHNLLNISNEHLVYGEEQVDIGPGSMRLLKRIVGQIRQAVLYDSLETLFNEDEQAFDRLLKNAAKDVVIARLVKTTGLLQGQRPS